MKYVLTFNKIEERLIAPCVALHEYFNYKVIDNMECMRAL
jgi:hypothetical protein